jgi:hypothetical protein
LGRQELGSANLSASASRIRDLPKLRACPEGFKTPPSLHNSGIV